MRRWWDSADSALVELAKVDGSAPVIEFGIALLGLHSVAKSALEPLAEQTLVDQAAIQQAYRSADFSEVAETVHTLACPSLGHAASCHYADLVVKACVEQSVNATQRLTQALVNKGMPWPKALHRAMLVAGVPLPHLGRYADSVSKNLDDLSLNDLADRALFEYVNKRSIYESDLSNVAKAERERHRMHEWDETKVKRDELGQFAAQEKLTEAEREEMRAKRLERQQRRERRLQRTQQAPKVQREQVAPKVQREQQTRRIARRPAARRIRDEKVGTYGFPLVAAENVPSVDEGKPVTVDGRLYVLEDVNGTTHSHAMNFIDFQATVEHFYREGSLRPGTLYVHMFDAGQLPVLGRTKPDALGLVRYPVLLEDPDSAMSMSLIRGEHVYSHVFYKDPTGKQAMEIPVYDSRVMFDVIKAERERHRQHEWDETKVKRDELGQFATQEKLTAAEREQMMESRRERIARRERRMKRIQAAEKLKTAEKLKAAEAKKVTHAELGQKVAREQQARKVVRREAPKIKRKQRFAEQSDKPETLDSFVKEVGRGAAFAVAPGVALQQLGFHLGMDDDYGIYSDRYAADVPLRGVLFDFDEYSLVSKLTANEYITLAKNLHAATENILSAEERTSDMYVPGIVESSAEVFGKIAGDVMHKQGRGAQATMAGIDWDVDSSKLDEAIAAQHLLTRDSDYGLVMDDRGELNAVRLPSPGKQAVIIISDPAMQALDDINSLTSIGGRISPAAEAKKRHVIERLRVDFQSPDATIPELLDFVLENSGLTIGFAPTAVKEEIAKKVLAQTKTGLVRLDGIDVIRIY